MILGIVQVRMGSTRLPKKALLEIKGKPMLQRLIDRLKCSKLIDKVVIATTNQPQDRVICEFAQDAGIGYYAGSENDIVDRIYQTAKKFKADVIVRTTGDCPLTDPEVVDKVIQTYLDDKDNLDYVSNVHPPTYPDGLDLDLVSFEALERLWNETKGDKFLREWFYTYMKENPEKFRFKNVENDEDLSSYRWTVDYEEDVSFINAVFSLSKKSWEDIRVEDILSIIREHPEVLEINRKYARDAAYHEALDERSNPK